MGDIGVPELLIILAIAIVVFGPARIAGVGKSLGQAIRSFRNEMEGDKAQGNKGTADTAEQEHV